MDAVLQGSIIVLAGRLAVGCLLASPLGPRLKTLWMKTVSFMYLCVCVLLFIFLSGIFVAGTGVWTRGLVSKAASAVNRALALAFRYGLSELLRTGGLAMLLGVWKITWRPTGRTGGVDGPDRSPVNAAIILVLRPTTPYQYPHNQL